MNEEEEEDNDMTDQDETEEDMMIEIEQQSQGGETATDTIMADKESNTESFTEGFNNQQFKNDKKVEMQAGIDRQLH
jgi:hypothetical protein